MDFFLKKLDNGEEKNSGIELSKETESKNEEIDMISLNLRNLRWVSSKHHYTREDKCRPVGIPGKIEIQGMLLSDR